MALAGTLEIQLLADVARIKSDMEKATGHITSGAKQMEKAAASVKSAFGGILAGLTAAAFSGWIKGAIDAADAAVKLSQKTGLAVKDVAGMQLAYRLAGVQGDALTTSMSRLSKGVVEGNIALTALGIKTKTAGGEFRGTKDVMLELADRFQKLPDGAQKTALALQIFGKAGAELIPLLNGGAQGIRDMDAMAEKLGLTISEDTAKQAEQFNDTLDLIGMGSKGVAQGIAAQLLPTLTSLASSFLTTMTSGDKLKNTAAFLASGLKILYTVAVGVVEVFNTVGKVLGGVAGMIVSALRGDFSEAASIFRSMKSDIGAGWAETARTVSRAWTEEGNASVAAAATSLKATGDLMGAAKAREKATKDAAAAAKKAAAEAEKEREKEEAFRIKWGRDDAIRQKEGQDERFKAEAEAAKDAAKAVDELFESRAKLYDLDIKSAKAGKDQLEAIQFETRALSMTNKERETAIALRELERSGMDKSSEAYKALAKDITEAVAQREAATEHKRIWDSIDATAHDVFTNIFEGGSNAFKKLGQTLKASVLDLLYSMTIKKWIISIGTATSGGVAQAATGGGSLLSSGGSILGGLGSSIATAYTAGSTSVGVMAGSVAGGGGIMGGAAAALGAIPVAGWIALAAIALYSAFGNKGGGPKTEGGYDATGLGISGLDIGGKQQGSVRGDVAQAQSISQGISGSYAALATQLGLVNSKLDVGIFYAMDNAKGGDSLTQLQVTSSAGYNRSDRTGGIENVARGEEELKKALAEETMRVMFDALKSSDLTEKYKAVLNAVAADAGVTEMEAAIKRITDARTQQLSLEDALFQMTATDAEMLTKVRDAERAAVDPLNAALLEQVYAQQDLLAATARTNAVMSEREGLQMELWRMEGNTAAIREVELSKLDESNRATQERIWQLEDERNAQSAVQEASGQLYANWGDIAIAAATAAQAAASQWDKTAKSIADAMAKLRGDIMITSAQSFAQAQAQFAMATARARAGDQGAADSLPALALKVQEMQRARAGSAFEANAGTAGLLASLDSTLKKIPSYDVGTPSVPRTGLALVHEGEEIIPAGQQGSGEENRQAEMRAVVGQLAEIRKAVQELVDVGVFVLPSPGGETITTVAA